MVSLTDDRPLLTLQQATRLFPVADDRCVHYETVRRWAKHGLNGVKLETVGSPRRRWTSVSAIQRFLERVNAVDSPGPAASSTNQSEADAAAQRIREDLSPHKRR